jgi:hypothetical protein
VSELDRALHTENWQPDDSEPSPNGTGGPFRPLDLAAAIRQPGVRPRVLRNLIYGGKLHSIGGPPEAGKTILLLWLMLAMMSYGRPAMLFDHETGPEQVSDLLRAMGADPDMIAELFTYVAFPETGWHDPDLSAMHELIADRRPAIVSFDSLGEMLGANGSDENKAGDVTRFANRVFLPITRRYGAAVIFTDHDAKGSEGAAPSRYSRGTTAKLGKTDVQIKMAALHPFSRDEDGALTLTVTKDRPGCLRRHWEIAVTRDPLTLSFRPGRPPAPGGGGMSPAKAKILDVLNEDPVNIRRLVDRIAEKYGHGLHRVTVNNILRELADDGLADKLDGGPGREALWIKPGQALVPHPAAGADVPPQQPAGDPDGV